MSKDPVNWIVSKTYRLRRRDGSNDSWIDISVAISAPRKLAKDERVLDSIVSDYGCMVQTGADITRRFVAGRNELEALFHGLLAIDKYLATVSEEHELQDENGIHFDARLHGLLFGPLAEQYRGSKSN